MTSAVSLDFGQTLYRSMLRIRRLEERIKAMYHLREMRSPPHLCMGHEAVAVGVCAALSPAMWSFPTIGPMAGTSPRAGISTP